MAYARYREENIVNWVGVRPGHNGEQIHVHLSVPAADWAIVYTVGAGKVLLLDYAFLCSAIAGAATQYLSVYTDAPAELARILAGYQAAAVSGIPKSASFWPPIEIPAGYSIRGYQSGIIATTCIIHGILVEA